MAASVRSVKSSVSFLFRSNDSQLPIHASVPFSEHF
jgi:hypothetical protein